jgi:uncharacterized protein (DUF362 family)
MGLSLDRRGFLRASLLAGFSPARLLAVSGDGPVVAVVRVAPEELSSGDPADLARKLARAVDLVAGSRDALPRLFPRGRPVGLKVNGLGGRGLSTSGFVVQAVLAALLDVGLSPGDILVFDRTRREAEYSRHPKNHPGVTFDGTGSAYDRRLFSSGEVGSCLSGLFLSLDSVINLPVLKDHDLTGVTLSLKNNFGIINNPNKYHLDGCDPYIADLNALPELRRAQKLCVLDAVRGQYDRGPASHPPAQWHCGRVLVATDPVAIDRVGWSLIEERRKEAGLPSLSASGRNPVHILTAGDRAHGLGCADLARIRLREVA